MKHFPNFQDFAQTLMTEVLKNELFGMHGYLNQNKDQPCNSLSAQ